jgi:ribosomal protein L7/L12
MGESKFNIILVKSGTNKPAMMKAVRDVNPKEFTGLKRAKDFIDNPPGIVVANVSQSVAEKAKAILENAGAVVEMNPV